MTEEIEIDPKKQYHIVIRDWRSGQELFFTATNLIITKNIISFTDKFGQSFAFNTELLLKIQEKSEEKKNVEKNSDKKNE